MHHSAAAVEDVLFTTAATSRETVECCALGKLGDYWLARTDRVPKPAMYELLFVLGELRTRTLQNQDRQCRWATPGAIDKSRMADDTSPERGVYAVFQNHGTVMPFGAFHIRCQPNPSHKVQQIQSASRLS